MITDWIQWGWITSAGIFGVLACGCLVACEASLVALRYRLHDQSALEELQKLKRVALLLRQTRTAAALIRFAILSSSTMATVSGVLALDFALGHPGTHGGRLWWLFLEGMAAISLVSLAGYLGPRGIALARPAQTLRLVSWPVAGLALPLFPWFRLQRWLAGHILRIVGAPCEEDYNILDFEVQVRALGEEGEDGALSARLQSILRNTLRLRELDVSAVLLPRHQVQIFDLEHSLEANLQMARDTGHTRFPLCEGNLDHCEGLIHIKDIFRQAKATAPLDLRKLRREILSFAEELPLEDALQRLLAHKVHMALVRDEFGGTIGVITLEAILEEIVGRIDDEFDVAEEERVQAVPGEERFQVDGLTPLHELEEKLKVEIETEEVSTFGGLVTSAIGYIPKQGESFELEDPPLAVTVLEADETRIIKVEVTRLNEDSTESNGQSQRHD